MARLMDAWRTLDSERRLATLAALGLFVSMFLPWYQQNAVVDALKTAPLQSRNLDAFQVFSFVEAAVLLVAVALLYMLFARAEGRTFNLPGGDGTVVLAAGSWTALLLVFRLFDKPGISSHGVAGNVGVQWGIFFALVAAGMITYAGSRMRAAHHPERPPRRRPASTSRPTGAPVEEPAAENPFATGEPVPEHRSAEKPFVRGTDDGERSPEAGSEPSPTAQLDTATPTTTTRVLPRGRPRYPPGPAEQLSFEDPSERAS